MAFNIVLYACIVCDDLQHEKYEKLNRLCVLVRLLCNSQQQQQQLVALSGADTLLDCQLHWTSGSKLHKVVIVNFRSTIGVSKQHDRYCIDKMSSKPNTTKVSRLQVNECYYRTWWLAASIHDITSSYQPCHFIDFSLVCTVSARINIFNISVHYERQPSS